MQQSPENLSNFPVMGNLGDSGCDSLLRLYAAAWNNLAYMGVSKNYHSGRCRNPWVIGTGLRRCDKSRLFEVAAIISRVAFIHAGLPVEKPKQLLKQAIESYNPAFAVCVHRHDGSRQDRRRSAIF